MKTDMGLPYILPENPFIVFKDITQGAKTARSSYDLAQQDMIRAGYRPVPSEEVIARKLDKVTGLGGGLDMVRHDDWAKELHHLFLEGE